MQIFKTLATDTMLWLAAAAAIITSFLSTPQVADINFHTLYSLLSMMILVQILEDIGLLQYFSSKFTAKARDTRQLMWMLVILAFGGAMLITNDVTVLIMVPLFFRAGHQPHTNQIWGVVLITAAANIGSALTPFGNTHNLFLLSHYNLALFDFFKISVPYSLLGLLLLLLITWVLIKPRALEVHVKHYNIQPRALIIALIVTIITFLAVFKIIPTLIAVAVAVTAAILLDKAILFRVDYATILTFLCFFVAVGNISRFPSIARVLQNLVHTPQSTFLTAVGFSQFMSNVPATILIAKFTQNIPAIFLGTNTGGLGTTIASMCNLLAYKQYIIHSQKRHLGAYFVNSLLVNLILLIIIGLLSWGLMLIFP